MTNKPLLRLLTGNIYDAHSLGLLDCHEKDIQEYIDSISPKWSENEKEFNNCMQRTELQFNKEFRPIQAFQGETITFCRIMTLRDFVSYWLSDLPLGSTALAERAAEAKSRLTELVSPYSDVNVDYEIVEVRESIEAINRWIIASPQGIVINVGAITDRQRPFWVSTSVEPLSDDAQINRDKLGMIHINMNSKPACSELMTRLNISVRLFKGILPRKRLKEYIKENPDVIFAIRPSVVHCGNRRFVQKVTQDQDGSPSKTGFTRDLSSDTYPESAKELILLSGTATQPSLVGLQLLNGTAKQHTRDSDNTSFVNIISQDLNWV